jgi:hypothetical protein
MAIEPGATTPAGERSRAAPFRISRPSPKGARASSAATKTSGLLAKSEGVSVSAARARGKEKATVAPASSSEETTSPVAFAGAFVILVKRSEGRS